MSADDILRKIETMPFEVEVTHIRHVELNALAAEIIRLRSTIKELLATEAVLLEACKYAHKVVVAHPDDREENEMLTAAAERILRAAIFKAKGQ